jgi:hypothetical protein
MALLTAFFDRVEPSVARRILSYMLVSSGLKAPAYTGLRSFEID